MKRQSFVILNVSGCARPIGAADQAGAIDAEPALRATRKDDSNQKFAGRAIRKQAD